MVANMSVAQHLQIYRRYVMYSPDLRDCPDSEVVRGGTPGNVGLNVISKSLQF